MDTRGNSAYMVRPRRAFEPHHDISGQGPSIRFELSGTNATVAHALGRPREAAVITTPAERISESASNLNFRPWLKYIPERVFAPAVSGFNPSIQEHIYDSLRSTHYYHYKGDYARVTTRGIHKLAAADTKSCGY